MKTRKLKVVFADVQNMFVDGLKCLLRNMPNTKFQFISNVESGEALINILSEHQIDLVFMDLNFNDVNGIDLIKKLQRLSSHTKICVMSAYTDIKFVKGAFQNGVDGFYSKMNGKEELESCIEALMEGETFLSKGLHITPPREKIVEEKTKLLEDRYMIQQKLTNREMEILDLITQAMNNREIGQKLFISHQTVGVHRKNIMKKLGVRNTVNLIRFALDHQLVK